MRQWKRSDLILTQAFCTRLSPDRADVLKNRAVYLCVVKLIHTGYTACIALQPEVSLLLDHSLKHRRRAQSMVQTPHLTDRHLMPASTVASLFGWEGRAASNNGRIHIRFIPKPMNQIHPKQQAHFSKKKSNLRSNTSILSNIK